MLIMMKPSFKEQDIQAIVSKVRSLGFVPHIIPGEHSVAVGITGNQKAIDPEPFEMMDGVEKAIRVTKAYKLAGREFKNSDTTVRVKDAVFGPGYFTVIAGPCAVENEDQTVRIAKKVKEAGAHVLRGGAFKPRSSPYSFQGMGLEGLKILDQARKETGLPVVTEALDFKSLDLAAQWVDIIQIGARNMQNFSLLQEVGKLKKPVLLKRGMSATIDEWLQAAEYILDGGNSQIILAERGIRSFDSHSRNMLDITAVPIVRGLSHLPILVDPSHGTGRRELVAPMSIASLAAGANAIMVDVHDRPKEALCDGPQAILPSEFESMMHSLRKVAAATGVKLSDPEFKTVSDREKDGLK